jgi:hypothetical protein
MTLRLLLAAALLTAAWAACKANLPPPVGCAPLTYGCVGDRPSVCSQRGAWEPAGDLRCAAIGGECVAPDGGPAHCAPRDAGADAAEVQP